jgi:aspartokinase/homoserine dehydrogenase 1
VPKARRSTQPSSARRAAPVVHKFGGAALEDARAVARAAALVARQLADEPGPAVVVASAMRGVTDALLVVGRLAAQGDEDGARRGIERLRARHAAVAREVAPSDAALAAVIESSFEELGRIAGGLSALGELTTSTSDAIIARGERLSAQLVTRALAGAGVEAAFVDATDVVVTDGRAGDAFPDLAATAAAAERVLAPLVARGVVAVVPGFIGAASSRRSGDVAIDRGPAVVTLGRGGSDLTATALGRVLGAREVRLWKDVPGLLTADPRVVPEARVIPSLHAREASELAYHGAKVLHPRALIPLTAPLSGARVPRAVRDAAPRLVLRPFAQPEAAGTTILTGEDPGPVARGPRAQPPVKAVSALVSQALVTLRGTGMAGVPGIAARAFGALERAGVSVSLISQASSEQSICLGIPATGAAAVPPLLRQAFEAEIARGEIEGVELEPAVATLAVVGSGMAGAPGIVARLFGALADAGVNIVAIAQGSSELCVSVVVRAADAARGQQAVHSAFRLDRIGGGAARVPHHADVVLLGFGKVGRELARQLARARAATPDAPAVEVVGVLDTRGYVFDPAGLTPRRTLRRCATASSTPCSALIRRPSSAARRRSSGRPTSSASAACRRASVTRRAGIGLGPAPSAATRVLQNGWSKNPGMPRLGAPARSDAAVVPAPPWWTTAATSPKSRSNGTGGTPRAESVIVSWSGSASEKSPRKPNRRSTRRTIAAKPPPAPLAMRDVCTKTGGGPAARNARISGGRSRCGGASRCRPPTCATF